MPSTARTTAALVQELAAIDPMKTIIDNPNLALGSFFFLRAAVLLMLAWCLQRLTLFAFTAHAVLGCCWHHGHPIGTQCCPVPVEELTQSEGALETALGSSVGLQCACGSANPSLTRSIAESSSHTHSQLASYEGLGEDFHPCRQSHCRFVSTKLLLLERDNKIATGERLDPASSTVAESAGLGAIGCRLPFVLYRQLASAGAHRAILQSWQI